MVNSVDFAKRLQLVFDYYQLNASTFAEKIGVGRASISHILSGRNKPSLDFVMKIINEFPEVELYWLLNGKGNFPSSKESQPSTPTFKNTTSVREDQQPEDQQKQQQTIASKDPQHPLNETKIASSTKAIAKVLILYTDGSFDSFSPND